MFKNDAIQCALITYIDNDDVNVEMLGAINTESEYLCDSIEYGLMELGDMMSRLGYLADTEQNFDSCAMSNDNVKHIGGLIKANAYLLNMLRNASAQANFHLNNDHQGGKNA